MADSPDAAVHAAHRPCLLPPHPAGIAARVLEERGLGLKQARAAVAAQGGATGLGLMKQDVELPLTGKAAERLEKAKMVARSMGACACGAAGVAGEWTAAAAAAVGQAGAGARRGSATGGEQAPKSRLRRSLFSTAAAPLAGVPNTIDCEQMLMSLLAEEGGAVNKLLAKQGIDPGQLRDRVRAWMEAGWLGWRLGGRRSRVPCRASARAVAALLAPHPHLPRPAVHSRWPQLVEVAVAETAAVLPAAPGAHKEASWAGSPLPKLAFLPLAAAAAAAQVRACGGGSTMRSA